MSRRSVEKFLESSFPAYENYTIVEENGNKIVAILDYGKYDKLRVTFGYDKSSHMLYKLLRTDFI